MTPAGVDVIIPCYNYGRYLRRCTESVLQESQLPVRVLIIDDASSDDSAAEARRIADDDGRVQVISHPLNAGHIATYNEGLAWVEAPYLLLLSADDIVAPGALARAVAFMEDHPSAAFVYGAAIRFSHEEELNRVCGGDTGAVEFCRGSEFVRRTCADAVNPVETATAVVRSTVQKRVGGYRPELPHAGDLEMWLRCAAQGDVGVIGAVQAYVRLHEMNMRHAYGGANVVADYLQRYQAFRELFRTHGRTIAGAGRLRRHVFTLLATELFHAASHAFDHGQPCQRLIAASAQIRPSIRLTRPYLRLALKRAIRSLMGERLWDRFQTARASACATGP